MTFRVVGRESGTARQQLVAILDELKAGGPDANYRFILLRETPLDERCVSEGDIDLLATEEDVARLLAHLESLVVAGRCAYRVNRRTNAKTNLLIFSTDGAEFLRFDLWIDLWQLSKGRECLRFRDVAHLLPTGAAGLLRLPVAVETAIYLHHLSTKRRDLSSQSATQRLNWYAEQLKASGNTALTAHVEAILATKRMPNEILNDALELIHFHKRPALPDETVWQKRIWQKLKRALTESQKHPRAIALIGCDGAGKTTMSNGLKSLDHSPVSGLCVAKQLYRRSLAYRLAKVVFKNVLRFSKDTVDDALSPVLFAIAAVRLRLRLMMRGVFQRRGLLLLDRSLVCFLYGQRKTDAPQFSRGTGISGMIGPSLPVIHLHVDQQLLRNRKNEVTETGHAAFDRDMNTFYTSRVGTDYVSFNNSGDATSSIAAVARIIDHCWNTGRHAA
jgi:hypothetical protein